MQIEAVENFLYTQMLEKKIPVFSILVKVLPHEVSPGDDRIPQQLMYIPPEGFVPENMDDSDVQLKTILLWNGVGKVSNNLLITTY